MFVWKASVILEQFRKFLPEVYACLVKIGDAMGTDSEMEAINEIYPVIPSISIDYGIMEKSDIVKVISADMDGVMSEAGTTLGCFMIRMPMVFGSQQIELENVSIGINCIISWI